MPTYTNIKIHDEAAKSEEFVKKFKQQLIQRQQNELEKSIKE